MMNDVCGLTGVTLSRYMLEMARANPELIDVESIFTSLQTACKTISSLVRRSALEGLTGLQGNINVQGEEQKKLDVITNDVLKRALRWSGKLTTLASEEEDAPVMIDTYGNEIFSSDVVIDTEGQYVAVLIHWMDPVMWMPISPRELYLVFSKTRNAICLMRMAIY